MSVSVITNPKRRCQREGCNKFATTLDHKTQQFLCSIHVEELKKKKTAEALENSKWRNLKHGEKVKDDDQMLHYGKNWCFITLKDFKLNAKKGSNGLYNSRYHHPIRRRIKFK